MPARLKLIVAYDGAGFAGWQSQAHQNTVQDHIERAFERVTGRPVRVHGAGRTDAGVHALAQCAHADLPDRRLAAAQWPRALNALLPQTIRVLRCRYVPTSFHARLSAKGKIYRYRIWLGEVFPPFEVNRAWHLPAVLDPVALETAAAVFVGRHDFAAFAANPGKREKTTLRTIFRIRVRRKGASVTIDFEGEGFLYKMVRLMTGAVVQSALGKIDTAQLAAALEAGHPVGPRIAAPAEGLFLVRVQY